MLAAANGTENIDGDTSCDEVARIFRRGRLQHIEQDVPVADLEPRLQNTVVNNIIQAVQQGCSWERSETQLVILCALSMCRRLPQRHSIIE